VTAAQKRRTYNAFSRRAGHASISTADRINNVIALNKAVVNVIQEAIAELDAENLGMS